MSENENKHADDDPERTLVTLEQLSQTIEVMTSVVNRLRQHLSEQLQAQVAEQKDLTDTGSEQEITVTDTSEQPSAPSHKDVVEAQQTDKADVQRESFVVEIRQHEPEPVRKNNKTLH